MIENRKELFLKVLQTSDIYKAFKEKKIVEQISGLVGWDYETYMPSKAVEQRGNMLSYLSKIKHDLETDPKIGSLLNRTEKIKKLKTTEVHDVVNLDERDCFCSFMSKDEECIKCDCAHLCREMTKYGERSP